jgi:exosortase/archaeosortase family protein
MGRPSFDKQLGITTVAVLLIGSQSAVPLTMLRMTRHLSSLAASAMGLHVTNDATQMHVGGLVLNWSADCSGVNTLLVLMLATLWIHRQTEKGSVFLLTRLLTCVPLALAVNLVRVSVIAVYRNALYPAIESATFHNFIGLACIVPPLLLISSERRLSVRQIADVLLIAAITVQATAELPTLAGYCAATSAAIVVSTARLTRSQPPAGSVLLYCWFVAAGLITLLEVESLWLIWLLLCPAAPYCKSITNWHGCLTLTGVLPIVGVISQYWALIVIVGGAAHLRGAVRAKGTDVAPLRETAKGRLIPKVATIVFVFAPFCFIEFTRRTPQSQPPPGCIALRLSDRAYMLQMPGQPKDLSTFWYDSDGRRHHALSVCMRASGKPLHPTSLPEVGQAQSRWLREYFIVNGRLLPTYRLYLQETAFSLRERGVHLIMEAPKATMSQSYFAEQCDKLAGELTIVERHRSQ